MRAIAFPILIAILVTPSPAWARIVEDQRWLPVTVKDSKGQDVSRQIMVTFVYDDSARQPHPALVLNHGRAPAAAERAALGRAVYFEASSWFAKLGFMVAVPTRIGYGVTGGPDVENTGDCGKKDYAPGYEASTRQTLAVLEYMRGWKEVAKDRTVVVGQSFGGTTAIAIAARNTPGVQATVNFAGGGGGRPVTHPGNPCDQPKLKKLFADYGKTARIPTLWVYSANDQFFGPTLPKVWFDEFKAAGGRGDFAGFPAHGENGHQLFTRGQALWQPRVLEFLRANGYPDLGT
jgi:dienelactone hydrolase